MQNKKLTPQQAAGVMYQIYPRSFKDTNGDGVGDLQGVIEELDYLAELGVNSIWLSPIYPSPMKDFGYDISNYVDIEPTFGNLDDFDKLIAAAHERGIKIAMDYVVNHTSDLHQWFVDSRSDRNHPKRDWYIWQDPAEDGGPPNNWLSIFGGPAWELDEATGQYYLHTFLKEQPDLNWRNPEVQQAMMDVLHFWIDRGVDGFRTDAFPHVMKDEQLRDEPVNLNFHEGDWSYSRLIHVHTQRLPELKELYAHFDEVFNEYPDRDLFMVMEDFAGMDDIRWHYDVSDNARFAPLNVSFAEVDWDYDVLKRYVDAYEKMLPETGWPNYALGNHDLRRVSERAGKNSLRVAALMLLTLRGTPIIYYGEEIGMSAVHVPPDRIQDPVAFRNADGIGRDPVRTPMQWSSSGNAGFTTGEPWLPLASDYHEVNVETERRNEQSLFNLYKRLIRMRTQSPALSLGTYRPCNDMHNRYVMTYWREYEGERLLIAINLVEEAQTIDLKTLQCEVLLATDPAFKQQHVTGILELAGDSGVVLRIAN